MLTQADQSAAGARLRGHAAGSWPAYTNIKSFAVASFSLGDLAQSLVRLQHLHNSSPTQLARIGMTLAARATLRRVLVAHVVISITSLVATLLLLVLGNIRVSHKADTKASARVRLARRFYRYAEVGDPQSLGWLCQLLNLASTICGLAMAVLLPVAAALHRRSVAVA